MRLITTECEKCGHRQEDLVGRMGEPEYEPCENCGHTVMSEVTGEIEACSAQKHPLSGSGPWG